MECNKDESPSGSNIGTGVNTQFRAATQQAQTAILGLCTPNYSNSTRNPTIIARNTRLNSGPHPSRPRTFWTSCYGCRMHYKYQWEYLNKCLMCPTCQKTFIAAETPGPHHRQRVFAASTSRATVTATHIEGQGRSCQEVEKRLGNDEAQHESIFVIVKDEVPSGSDTGTSVHARFHATPQHAQTAMRNLAIVASNPQPNSDPHPSRPGTFWTLCNGCRIQYQYQWKFLNESLLCPACNRPFIAIEMPAPSAFQNPHHHQVVFAASTSRATETATSNEGVIRSEEEVEISRNDEAQHEGASILEKAKTPSTSSSCFPSSVEGEKPMKRRCELVQNTNGSGEACRASAGIKLGMHQTSTSFGENPVSNQAAPSSSYKRRSEPELCKREIRSMLVAKAKMDILQHLNE